MRTFGESGICKTGAKGVVAAGVPELGLGIALKAQDETKRAVEVAHNFILHEIVLKPKDPNFRIEQPLYNYNHLHIGYVPPLV
jgi:L-asparaginase II